MATIGCKDFPDYLEPWMEGDRHPDALAHLRDCPRFRCGPIPEPWSKI